jgi:hypothetical protein
MRSHVSKLQLLPFVDALFVLINVLLYKASNHWSLSNALLDGMRHLINPLLSYNRILPQLAIKLCNISVKAEMTL